MHARPTSRTANRRGSMVPALAFALVVVGSAMALVFERLWQDAARIELRTAAEAAALAAAQRLCSDDTLREDIDWRAYCDAARQSAAQLAAANLVGGAPLELDAADDGDIRLGLELDNILGQRVFVESRHEPRIVRVQAWHGRGRNNAAGLLSRHLSGAGRLQTVAVEATAANHIAGVRPLEGLNVPALPIALHAGNLATGLVGWTGLIERRLGPDACGVDPHGRPLEGVSDGIPEMLAISAPYQADEKEQLAATLHAIDVGAGLSGDILAAQCRLGWSLHDLESSGGELRCDGPEQTFASTPKLPAALRAELSAAIGQPRICWLFDAAIPGRRSDECQLTCRRLVAIRILGVQELPDGMLAVRLQPAVVITKTAIVAPGPDDRLANPYVSKVYLSR
ncbi:MAG: hypothetical protein KF774_04715 [Planctomyces sp.]|nr:hypothetical protein [Planctomyces sp.]